MYVHDQEALKLSIVCMRTGFTQAHVALSCSLAALCCSLVSLSFSVCSFVWSAVPAFSCQYLDKDELLHLAGANNDLFDTSMYCTRRWPKIANCRRLVAVNHGSQTKSTDGSKSGWKQRR